ncbi:MAG: ABC transporter ATP-binding protein [Firmicutes bacterium]|nr:ABC transporter ATP-binding protein [Bacillota bacterium]
MVLTIILTFLQSMSSLYLPNLMSNIVDTGVLHNDTRYIVEIGGVMLFVALLGVACSVAAGLYAAKSAAAFGRDLRRDTFGRVETFMLREFDQIGTSSLIVRTTNDIMQVQQFVNMMLRMMIMAPLMGIGGIIMAVYTDAPLSLIIVVVMPILGASIFLILSRQIALFRTMQAKVDVLNRVVREHLSGVRVVRSFGRTPHEQKRFQAANEDVTDVSVRVYKIMALLMPIMMFVLNFSTLAIIWFGGIRINDGAMQIGSLMAFIQYATQILMSVMMASAMFFMIPRAQASAVRINEVLDTEPAIVDPVTPQNANMRGGFVEFKNVTFRHPGAESAAVDNVSFTLRPGEITAIIGGTGSGKTSLINLIPRFYECESGAVLVDGVDVREQEQQTLRHKIGFVPQKAVLFTGTISENIRYGKPDASDDDVRHAADIAQATEFILEMQDGFASPISQGGGNVSGGQKQRLAIARALVRKPEVYIFDDSFSALDFKTDSRLRAALKNEVQQATVVIVAQRVSTVMDADRILVLDEGKLVGNGRHRELMKTCDVYREIVSSQMSEEESA